MEDLPSFGGNMYIWKFLIINIILKKDHKDHKNQ